MTRQTVEINCTACGADTLAKKVPVYDGFTRVAERWACVSCGHEYPDEESTPFKDGPRRPKVFSEADRPKTIEVFHESEKGRFCRYCEHYVVNPFLQKCSLHFTVVEATDTCPDFTPAEQDEDEDKENSDD
jgi:hypothetical protein